MRFTICRSAQCANPHTLRFASSVQTKIKRCGASFFSTAHNLHRSVRFIDRLVAKRLSLIDSSGAMTFSNAKHNFFPLMELQKNVRHGEQT
jgi:hypothetical protein